MIRFNVMSTCVRVCVCDGALCVTHRGNGSSRIVDELLQLCSICICDDDMNHRTSFHIDHELHTRWIVGEINHIRLLDDQIYVFLGQPDAGGKHLSDRWVLGGGQTPHHCQ
jgi:hypothetical protein